MLFRKSKSLFQLSFLRQQNKRLLFNNYPIYNFSQKPPKLTPQEGDKILAEMDEQVKKQVKETEFEDDHSFEKENSNTTYVYFVGALGLVLGYIVMQVNILRHDKKKKSNVTQTYQGRADIGGPWDLIDLNGNKYTHLNLKGSYYLLYFGFCNCPDICPNSLHKLSKAIENVKNMPEAKYINLKSVFVSVDPDRDSFDRIQRFLNLFHPEMIGLTSESNNSPNLKDMMKKFRIYATKIEYEMLDNEEKKHADNLKKDGKVENFKNAYTIDHTVLTYLMDDDNNYVTHIGSNMNEHDMATLIVEKVLENERNKIRHYQNQN